jgi:hypothetical protein
VRRQENAARWLPAWNATCRFIRDGLEHGDREVHIVAPSTRERHVERLREAGIDVEAAKRAGQLAIRVIDEIYLPDDGFDPDAKASLGC